MSMESSSGIRDHMRSIKQTVQISNAQKLIAGARIVKARKMLERSRLYHDRIQRTVASVFGDCAIKNIYMDYGQDIKKRGLLVIAADRGLAGGYNHNLMKLTDKTMAEKPVAKLLVAGHAGYMKFARTDVPLEKDFKYSVENPILYTAREMAEQITGMFENEEVDCFDVIYTQFKSAAHMIPSIERLFPLSPGKLGDPKVHFAQYMPSADEVLEVLIPKYLKGFIFGCLVQAWICELNSRVSAMDSAIKNGNEMLAKLSLHYNQIRQGAITQEISEIVAGAASMEMEEEI
jgi:F-type H+-transporting ATPase subunit gamma